MKKFCVLLFLGLLLLAINFAFPYPQVSYELQSGLLAVDPAPWAPTSRGRMFLWISKYAPQIRAEGAKYHIDPVAIAGVIAWEGAENDHLHRMTLSLMVNFTVTKGLFLKSMGPGKVQAWGPNNAAAFIEGNPHYIPVFPPLPPSLMPDTVERILQLRDPQIAIAYIAAIMNAYATEAEAAGYTTPETSLRLHPEFLGTFFAGVHGFTLPQARAAFTWRIKEKGLAPFQTNEVGRWIGENIPYLASSVAP